MLYYKNMWKYWVSGILGLFIVILPYAGFPFKALQALMAICGAAIAVISFWSLSENKKKEG